MNTNADAVPSLLEPTPMKEGQFGDKEPEFRMDAYYYGFAPTGLLVIDRILSAVACAGKSFHHTDCWTDQCTPYDHLRGETVTDWIQNAADDAADAIRRAPASKVQADHIAGERKMVVADLYLWLAGSNDNRFIRAWTDDPARVDSLREAIGLEPVRYYATPAQPCGEDAATYAEFGKARERLLSGAPVQMSERVRELARQALAARDSDTRTDDEKIAAAVDFICDTRFDQPVVCGEDAANGAIGEREAMRKILNEQMAENRPFRAKRKLPPIFYNGDTKRDPELRELANDSEVVRRSIESFALTAENVAGPKLAVWYGSMPESNGKTNWTAILHRGDVASGMTIDMSEYPDRVRYEADRMRWMIGDLDKEPFILDYDADKHSGYVAEKVAQAEPVAWTSPDRLKRIAERNRHVDTIWPASMRDEGDVPLYTAPQPTQTAQAEPGKNNNPATQKIIERWIEGERPAQTAQSGEPVAWRFTWANDSLREWQYLNAEPKTDKLRLGIPGVLNPDSGRKNWEPVYAAPQPAQTAVVLDDERAAFEKIGREFKDCFGHITPEEALRAINACGKFGDDK